MNNNINNIEKRLWEAADQLRANSELRSSEYSMPVLGLVFLKYADHRFKIVEKDLASKGSSRRTLSVADYYANTILP